MTYDNLKNQTEKFIEIVCKNPNIEFILNNLKLPDNYSWYLAAGCLNQTVWNYLTNRDITYGINDYDIVYWDEDESKEKELIIQQNVLNQLKDLNLKESYVEVVNQKIVHHWFEEDFGKKIDPYINIEHAISTFPATVTCIGITKINDSYNIIAPYGLSDLFNMNLRPNIPSVLMPVFKSKVKKWKSKWPELKVIDLN